MEGVPNISPPWVSVRQGPPREAAIARLAESQYGVVTLSQLCSLGLGASAVRRRVAEGRLHRIHQGVFAVGHPLLNGEGRWKAAVLACGKDAVLSHRSAAAHWRLRPDNRPRTDVTVPRRYARNRPRIAVHASMTFLPRDVTVQAGIPCTTVARTILDLAEEIDRRGVERAIEQAEVLRIYDGRALEDVLERADGRRGTGVVRDVLGELEAPTPTKREFEERFLALCRMAGIPQPEVNAWVALDGDEVQADFLWRRERLVVETDGWDFHRTRQAFERDRRRDQRLVLAGFTVVRFTWRQLTDEPHGVATTIRELLGR
jgi:predicted transcriptional regulator of viral defense system